MASENTPSRTLELTGSHEFSSSPTSSSAREGRVRQGRLVDGGRNRSFAEHGLTGEGCIWKATAKFTITEQKRIGGVQVPVVIALAMFQEAE